MGEDFKKKNDKFLKETKKREDTESNLKQEINKEIGLHEVEQIIKKLTNRKAAGIDGISGEVLKYGGKNIGIMIWKLCALCFRKEKKPEEWKVSVISPIHKAGDTKKPGNYRGISLLCIVSKVYEAVLYKRMIKLC